MHLNIHIKHIFEKLEDLPTDEKTLPMNLENNIFTSAEEKSMTQSGYLKRDGEKLYLPEIIRTVPTKTPCIHARKQQ